MLYIRKANERGHANHGWLDSYHTFSFASYYDPKFMGFSSLRVINEDRVKAGFGFGTHPHDNMEILSYVLDGTIAHKDSMGNVKELKAGEFQIMSAGTGVTHSEFNPSNTENLHFYQIWIQPNEFNIKPRYDQKAFEDKEGATLILSPNAENDSFKIYQDMKLWRYQLSAGNKTDIELDTNRNYWLQVVKGNFSINGQAVETSDGIAISKETLASIEPANDVEFLVFDLA
ncbi:pirin family protein [Haemophilus haemoglobinophilus]|nr:pirin family protein [Canicola haemoglobinophilus]